MRTFALPCDETPYTFVMEYEYDSWNRIQRMTYPDREVVSYQYDKGGMLKSVKGVKNGVTYKYIDSIKYNKFELKEAVYYGNGTRVHYTYDTLQRLSHLVSYTAPASPGGAEMMQDIYYTYDSVSNITDMVNYASQLSNGLGGRYGNHYRYDNLYRLTRAEGYWYGVSNLNYNLSMGYSKNGRVGKKVLTAGTLLNGNFSTVSCGRNYHYNTSSQKNTIIRIDGSENHDFQWDATGNMIYHRFDGIPGERFLCWDEENRLQGVKDIQYLSLYQYDANGERTYKLTGGINRQNISGRWSAFYLLDNPTLYPSPYMVVTRKGYTKHYYAENERIASRIGGGGIIEIDSPIVRREDVKKKVLDLNSPHLKKVLECLINPDVSVKNTLKDIYKYKDIVTQEKDAYWYHPDHLGSSSWITYSDGSAIQHLHYLPWGEDFVDQRSTTWNAMYTFSAKEKDTETGYSYFGARYYSSDLSIWLSVDPMSDKYPHQSNYVYCSNNPIRITDPNGEDEWEVDKKGNITWKRKSEKHQLFAVDKKGNRTGEFITLKNENILTQLKDGKKNVLRGLDGNICEEGNKRKAIVGKNDVDDLLKVFKFVADNSDVEWEFEYSKEDGRTQYSLVTDGFSGQVTSHFGSKAITSIHSHPNEPNNYQSELNSLYGDRGYLSSYTKTNIYVYMPKSTRLFNVNKNAYIRHINNDYRRFINLGR